MSVHVSVNAIVQDGLLINWFENNENFFAVVARGQLLSSGYRE